MVPGIHFRLDVFLIFHQGCVLRELQQSNFFFPRDFFVEFLVGLSLTVHMRAGSLCTVNKHQNSNQLAKKLVALGFRRIGPVELESFSEVNEP